MSVFRISIRGVALGAILAGVVAFANVLAVSGGTTIDLEDRGVTSGTGWSYAAATNTYNITGDVTVVGLVTDANATMTLDIAGGAKVDWAAKYASAATYNDTLVAMPGDGTLNILQTAYIRNTGSGLAIRSTGNSATLNVSGIIDSQTGGAVWANGLNAKVVVDGGMITAMGTGTVQPTVYLYNQGNNTTNVTIKGMGYVAANAWGAPAIQTYGNVVVEDTATVYQVGGSGAGKGPAINALGPNSSVTVRGGKVFSDEGVAIHTNAAGASVVVVGGQVYSRTGARAIYSQNANSSVTVEGGIVFANNATVSATSGAGAAVINASNLSTAPDGVVAGWNSGAGNTVYDADTSNDIVVLPLGATARWQQDNNVDGIAYHSGTGQNVGFFPVSGVTVDPVADTLYFDVTSGKFYTDYYGSATLYIGQAELWSWNGSVLSLRDFHWTTAANYALYVVNGNVKINLSGSNEFKSEATAGMTVGVLSDYNIAFEGGGAVAAIAGVTGAGANSYGISANRVDIDGGTVTARGETMAIFNYAPATTTVGLENYVYWENLQASDPGGAGVLYVDGETAADLAYAHDIDSKFVKVQPLTEVDFGVVQVGGRADSADSTGLVITFDEPISDLVASHITVRDGTGRVITGAIVGSGTTWTIELDEVVAQGEITVTTRNFGTYMMETASQTVEVYKLRGDVAGEPVVPGVPNTGVGL